MNKNGYEHVETCKGMYWIKEAGIIKYKQMVKKIKPHGYSPI